MREECGGRDGGRESQAGSRLSAVSREPVTGMELTNREMVIGAEIQSLRPNGLNHPRAPSIIYFIMRVLIHLLIDIWVVCVSGLL